MPMDKQLYIAIKKGDKKVVQKYKEPFATQLSANKNTVLHVAAESKNFYWKDSTDFLAMVGWDMLFSLNSSGDTCIHLAIRAGNLDAVKAIIDYMNQRKLPKKFRDIEAGNIKGASALPRMTNDKGNTALHLAPRGDIDLVKANADFSHPLNNAGRSPLYEAAEEGNADAVEHILKKCSSPSYAGPYGTTALHAAVISHSEFCVELLLKKKPSLTKQADNCGWNPLHYVACISYSKAIVRKLLLADKEMAYETTKETHMTPLHTAAIEGQLEFMKEIVEQCPDSLDAVTSQGQNVLHLAYLNEGGFSRKQKFDMIGFLNQKRWLYYLSYQRDAYGNFPDCATGEQTVLSHPLLKFISVKDLKEKLEKWEKDCEEQRKASANECKERQAKIEKEHKDKKENDEEANWIETSNTNTHLIVATLILTISFAAGFTIPGGFHSSDGHNEGMAILGKKEAFKAFAITDTIAMITSSSVVFLHYLAALELKLEKRRDHYKAAAVLVLVAMIAMMIAFMTGLYVMLPSTSLAVFICVCCSLSIIFFIVLLYRFIKADW